MTTVEVTPRSSRPPIRLRPAPQYEPPFDDERDPDSWASAHQLALVWPARAEPEEPARPKEAAARAQRREATESGCAQPDTSPGQARESVQTGIDASPGPATGAGTSGATRGAATGGGTPRSAPGPTTVAGTPGTPPGALTDARNPGTPSGAATDTRTPGAATDMGAPGASVGAVAGAGARDGGSRDAKLAVRRFVGACVEVLNGYRPAAHLRRLALPAEAARVVAQAIAGAHRVAELRRGDSRRPAHRARARPAPVGVIHLWLCEPRPGAVEASVVLVTGDRTWALALRLELHHESWLATALRLV